MISKCMKVVVLPLCLSEHCDISTLLLINLNDI